MRPGLWLRPLKRGKRLKYSNLDASHFFVPIAIETLGAVGPEAQLFLRELARRIAACNQEPLAHQYLLQRISVAIQRENAAAVLGTTEGSFEVEEAFL